MTHNLSFRYHADTLYDNKRFRLELGLGSNKVEVLPKNIEKPVLLSIVSLCTLKVYTNIASPSISNVNLVSYSKLPPTIYRNLHWHLYILTYRPNFCILSPSYLVQEMVHTYKICQQKRRVCTPFPFVILVIVLLF